VESRDDKRPNLSDARGSGAIEENSDGVLFLYRPAYYLERAKFKDEESENKRIEALLKQKNVLEVIIAKQRDGPTKTVNVFAEMASNAIRNLG
jgi:replicative DNA helicase